MAGTFSATRCSELVEHGIHTEDADERIHVGFQCGVLIRFNVAKALEAVKLRKPRRRNLPGQQSVRGPTADGFACPMEWIAGLTMTSIPMELLDRFRPDPRASTSVKGRAACDVACAMVPGLQPALSFADKQGTDMYRDGKVKVQIKCDWRAGPCPIGSGNVYLQTHERNPRKLI